MKTEYIVVSCSVSKTRTGSDYYQMKVSNESEIVSLSIWDVPVKKNEAGENEAKPQPLPVGLLLTIDNIRENAGKKSCSYKDIAPGEMAKPEHPLYAKAPRPIAKEEWNATIAHLLEGCTHNKLKQIISDCAQKLYPKYSVWPAATAMHHAFPGGLLNHTHQMLHMLRGLYPCLPHPIRLERCVLAILFHDYGKLSEYNEAGTTQPNMYLLGHIYMGAHALQNELEKHGIDKEETKRILHCVLAHHGQLEFGSPVLPCTQEAMIVNFLDMISAKSDSIECTGNLDYAYSLGTHVVKG